MNTHQSQSQPSIIINTQENKIDIKKDSKLNNITSTTESEKYTDNMSNINNVNNMNNINY